MNPTITDVKAKKNYKLELTFSNTKKGTFDMNPYLDKGIYKKLKNKNIFNTAHISFDAVEWKENIDIDPELLYQESIKE